MRIARRQLFGSLLGALTLIVPTLNYAYEVKPVSNGGTLKGQITYSGMVPTKQIIPDDPDICGKPRKKPQIMLDANKGVTDAVVYFQDIKQGKAWPKADPPTLDNVDCRFEPQMLTMQPGQVIIVNSDPILHNTHLFHGRRTVINVALPKKGLKITKELDRPGILRIECDEHGHMNAAGYVALNPYYSDTRNGGNYSIENIPPGDYKVVVYQRQTGAMEKSVTIKAGETTNLSVDLAQ